MAAYLKDGTLDMLGIEHSLLNGFRFPDGEFLPVAYVISVKGEPAGGLWRGKAGKVAFRVFTAEGFKIFRMEEGELFSCHIYDDMWIGSRFRGGGKDFGCYQEGSGRFHIFDRLIWEKAEERERTERMTWTRRAARDGTEDEGEKDEKGRDGRRRHCACCGLRS